MMMMSGVTRARMIPKMARMMARMRMRIGLPSMTKALLRREGSPRKRSQRCRNLGRKLLQQWK
jgi:hypothetical protein